MQWYHHKADNLLCQSEKPVFYDLQHHHVPFQLFGNSLSMIITFNWCSFFLKEAILVNDSGTTHCIKPNSFFQHFKGFGTSFTQYFVISNADSLFNTFWQKIQYAEKVFNKNVCNLYNKLILSRRLDSKSMSIWKKIMKPNLYIQIHITFSLCILISSIYLWLF